MKFSHFVAVSTACLAALSSCAIQREIRLQQTLDTHLRQGQYKAAMSAFDSDLPREGAYRDLQRGELLMLQGARGVTESQSEFEKVDSLVEDWVEKLRTQPEKTVSKVAGYIFTEGLSSKYDLKDYELSALSYRLAIQALLHNKWSVAAVRARQLSAREQALADNKKLTEETLKSEAEEKKSTAPKFENIEGYPVNVLTDASVLSLKNSYQSAAAHYLAGFIFEANREVSMAAPNYRLAIELQPSTPFLRESLARLESNVSDQSDRGNRRSGAGEGTDILLIVETGLLSEITCEKMVLPWAKPFGTLPSIISFAIPVIHVSPHENPGQFSIANASIRPVLVTDLDLMSRRWLKDAMPGFIWRSVTRMIASMAAQTALDIGAKAAYNAGGLFGSIFGAISSISSVAVGIGSALTNISDVRYWSTLPSAIYMARIKLPRGKQSFVWRNENGETFSVKIPIKGKYGIVYARVLGGRLTLGVSGMGVKAGGRS